MFMNLNRRFFTHLSALLLGMMLSFLPLVGDFHVETAQLAGLLIAIYSVFVATRFYSNKQVKEQYADVNADRISRLIYRQSHNSGDDGHGSRWFSRIGSIHGSTRIFSDVFQVLALLLLPIFVRALFLGCLSVDGILIIMIITIPTVVVAVVLARLISHLQFKWPLTLGLFVLFFLSVVLPLFILRQVPHAYVFNVIWGWFPGPIYDEEVRFTWSLLIHRSSVLLLSALLWLIPEYPKRWKLLLVAGVFFLFSLFLWQSLGVFRTLGTIEAELGSFKESDNFRLVYDASGMTPFAVDYWLLWHEFHLSEIRDVLEVEPMPDKIISVLYKDRWQKHKYTGAKNTSYVPVWSGRDQMHLDLGTGEYLLRHELVHVVAKPLGLPILGASFSMGLTEGIAVANEDPRSKPATLNELVAASGVLPSVNDLRKIFTPWGFYGGRGAVNYTISGSFACHLMRNGSVEELKAAYRSGNMNKSYGYSFYELYNSWVHEIQSTSYDTLTSRSARTIFGRESIFESDCPRRVTSLTRKWDSIDRLYSRGQIDDAANVAEGLVRDYPESPTIWARWSFLEITRGRGLAVINSFKSTWEDDPNGPIQLKLRYADALVSHEFLDEAELVALELMQAQELLDNLNFRGIGNNLIKWDEWLAFNNAIYIDEIIDLELLPQLNASLLAYYVSVLNINTLDASVVVTISNNIDPSLLEYSALFRLATFVVTAKAIGIEIPEDLIESYNTRLRDYGKSLIQNEQVQMLERFRSFHKDSY
jgi:hypothetical protein